MTSARTQNHASAPRLAAMNCMTGLCGLRLLLHLAVAVGLAGFDVGAKVGMAGDDLLRGEALAVLDPAAAIRAQHRPEAARRRR